MTQPDTPIYVALDTPDLEAASALARQVAGSVGGLKLGLEFFTAHGVAGVRRLAEDSGLPVFLDLKYHDIPNTVAGALRAACAAAPAILNVHAVGGRAMLEAAAQAVRAGAEAHGVPRPLLIAVTVLTSLNQHDLADIGVARAVDEQVIALARLTQDCGLDGVVCSPHEAAALRQACGPKFKLIVPGVRPAWAGADDQKRIMTPAEARAAGADVLVIGRPITAAADPAAAARRIREELA